jgi:hypothetical protein
MISISAMMLTGILVLFILAALGCVAENMEY